MNLTRKARHPDPQRQRAVFVNLNGMWDFSFEPGKYDRRICVPFSWEAPASGVAETGHTDGWYRTFATRHISQGSRLFLCFGGVEYTCEVYVNGRQVGSHEGGYSCFSFDVTDAWGDGDNEITLHAKNEKNDWQMTGKQGYGATCGIWQTVYLEERPPIYIADYTVETRIDGRVTVTVQQGGGDGGARLRFALCPTPTCRDEWDPTDLRDAEIFTGEGNTLSFCMADPQLWSPDTPFLYHGCLMLESDAGTDCLYTYFGVREIGNTRLPAGYPTVTLNGTPHYFAGVLDQAFHPTGFFTQPSDEDVSHEILRCRDIGLNFARIHIKAEEPLKLYYADLHGLMVMEDIPCFWGEPTERARAAFEREMWRQVARDRNHPAVFAWIIFNETWGLKTFDGSLPSGYRYLPETQAWVVDLYHRLKAADPSRIVEDNSPCNRDHTETDLNSWHFYTNGYENVKNTIEDFCAHAHPGATENFAPGYTCPDVPAMNSECGNVWGIQGSAGDSDISWHYHYMMNELRLHDRLCGFVFTELHDVTNEFNGFYRIDGDAKDFGYGGYVPGMTLRDLHAPLFLACDCPPMRRARPGERVEVPLALSVYAPVEGRRFGLRWELVRLDGQGEEHLEQTGACPLTATACGLNPQAPLRLVLPQAGGVCTLRLLLCEGDAVLMRNFVCFDVPDGEDGLSLPLDGFEGTGFDAVCAVQNGRKLNALGNGALTIRVRREDIPGYAEGRSLCLTFEASARPTLSRERAKNEGDGEVIVPQGGSADPGMNRNSFFMTDGQLTPSTLSVEIGGRSRQILCGGQEGLAVTLPDAPADSRGCLSWQYQERDDLLDEAGSYGWLCRVALSPAEAEALPETFDVTLRADGGLSLFGRESGRYPTGVRITAE